MSMHMFVQSGEIRALSSFIRKGGFEALSPGAYGRPDRAGIAEAIERIATEAKRAPVLQRIQIWFVVRKMRKDLSRMSDAARGGVALAGRQPLPLGQTWHVLHYLLTGSADGGAKPAASLLIGGREIGADGGYGRARVLSVGETAAFADYLATLSPAEVVARMDRRAMRRLEVYCAPVDQDDEAEMAEVCADALARLTAYVAESADKRHALALYIA